MKAQDPTVALRQSWDLIPLASGHCQGTLTTDLKLLCENKRREMFNTNSNNNNTVLCVGYCTLNCTEYCLIAVIL